MRQSAVGKSPPAPSTAPLSKHLSLLEACRSAKCSAASLPAHASPCQPCPRSPQNSELVRPRPIFPIHPSHPIPSPIPHSNNSPASRLSPPCPAQHATRPASRRAVHRRRFARSSLVSVCVCLCAPEPLAQAWLQDGLRPETLPTAGPPSVGLVSSLHHAAHSAVHTFTYACCSLPATTPACCLRLPPRSPPLAPVLPCPALSCPTLPSSPLVLSPPGALAARVPQPLPASASASATPPVVRFV